MLGEKKNSPFGFKYPKGEFYLCTFHRSSLQDKPEMLPTIKVHSGLTP